MPRLNKSTMNQITLGLVLILIGTVYLLDQLRIISFDLGYVIGTFWPVILIYFSVVGILFQRKMKSGWIGTYFWNFCLLAFGLYFLGINLGYIHMSIGDLILYFIPIALILFGFRLLLNGMKFSGGNEDHKGSSSSKVDESIQTVTAEPISDFDKKFEERFGHHSDLHKRENDQSFQAYSDDVRSHMNLRGDGSTSVDGNTSRDGSTDNRNSFIGDVYIGQQEYELKPLNISHFIGDTVIDLTKAFIPTGETRINISSFIGDVKIFVPNDLDLKIYVISSSFIGDNQVFDRHEDGMFRNINMMQQGYEEAEKKVRIHVSTFIGDLRVQRVG